MCARKTTIYDAHLTWMYSDFERGIGECLDVDTIGLGLAYGSRTPVVNSGLDRKLSGGEGGKAGLWRWNRVRNG